jgi:hypothetical protein
MPESDNKMSKPRRKFMSGMMAGIGGVLAFSRGASASDLEVTETETADQKDSHKGYHETAHIRSYYDKARF